MRRSKKYLHHHQARDEQRTDEVLPWRLGFPIIETETSMSKADQLRERREGEFEDGDEGN